MGFLDDVTNNVTGTLGNLRSSITNGISDILSPVSTVLGGIDTVEDLIDGAVVLANPRQKETDWEFSIFPKNPLTNISLETLGDVASSAELKYKIRSIAFPQLTLETQRTPWGTNPNTKANHPEIVHITIEEDIFSLTHKYFQNWLESIYDPMNNVYKVLTNENDVLRDGILSIGKEMPGLDVLGVTGRTFKFSSMKILGFEPITLVYDGDDMLAYTITFAVEKILPLGVEFGIGNSNLKLF